MINLIEWNVDDIEQTVSSLDDLVLANNVINAMQQEDFDIDDIKTIEAMAVCKIKLMGEYNALLVRNMEEYLFDAEVYLITWDGEASDGGEMFRLLPSHLEEIIDGNLLNNREPL